MMPRLDRLASLYLIQPLKREDEQKRLRRIPILMYHSISEQDEGALHPYYRTATAPQVFAKHMECLNANGYETVGLSEAVREFEEPGPTARKLVVITFDDGYADFLGAAFPALNKHGYTATVFLPTSYIGNSTIPFKGKACLTWSEVCELHRAGISFGSHTVTHPQLSMLCERELEYEIKASKQVIEDKLGSAVETFAYPYAFPERQVDFVRKLRKLLGASGYKQGVCTNIGTENGRSDKLTMRRLPMNSCDDLALLSAKLAGAYDWLAIPQALSKLAKVCLGSNQLSRLRAKPS